MTQPIKNYVHPDIAAKQREILLNAQLDAQQQAKQMANGIVATVEIIAQQSIMIEAVDMNTGEHKLFPRFVLRGVKHTVEGQPRQLIYFDGAKNFHAQRRLNFKPASVVHGLHIQIKRMKNYAAHLIMYDNARNGDEVIYEYVHGLGEAHLDKLNEYLKFIRV